MNELVTKPSILEKKDKVELRTIVEALGGESNDRQTKAELISEINRLSDKGENESGSDSEADSETVEDNSDNSVSSDGSNEFKRPSSSNKNSDTANSKTSNSRVRKAIDRQEAGNDPISNEPQNVSGFLDLRDEGYGFLRVNGFLPSKDDVYVSVKQVRQYGLRKGDHISGKAMPAHRNEKNPCFSSIDTVNGSLAADSLQREHFDEMVAGPPTSLISLEQVGNGSESINCRLIDLFAPIGKGQRALILGSNRSGRTSLAKQITKSVENNYPDINLLILSVDSRPEEVSTMTESLNEAEIVASTFDRPAEEHIAIAELTLERAKRLAEKGADVFIIVDNLTQLAKAYVSNFVHNTRSSATAIEFAALQPIKSFLGAAVNLIDAGSITLVSVMNYSPFSGSDLDALIYEELNNFSNCQISLLEDTLSEPTVDVEFSSTISADLLIGEEPNKAINKVRLDLVDTENQINQDEIIKDLLNSSNNEVFLTEIQKKSTKN